MTISKEIPLIIIIMTTILKNNPIIHQIMHIKKTIKIAHQKYQKFQVLNKNNNPNKKI
jgi:hypothetical protein